MMDPLAEVVRLLQPTAPFSKLVSGAGRWSVHRAEAGKPLYGAILDGTSRLAVAGREPMPLTAGDFFLIPAAFDFTMSSLEPPPDGGDTPYVMLPNGEVRHGDPNGPPDVRMIVGYPVFASPDTRLLVSLLPELVHVRGEARLSTLVELVREESRGRRPARDVVLERLLEVLFIEALRCSTAGSATSPGLLRGLADERLAVALRLMHESPTRPWTVAQLANAAAMSRSVFSDRFSRAVGVAPMEYLLGWRMALARTCCGASGLPWARSRRASATAPRARSASPSHATPACRRRTTRGRGRSRYTRERERRAPNSARRPAPAGGRRTSCRRGSAFMNGEHDRVQCS